MMHRLLTFLFLFVFTLSYAQQDSLTVDSLIKEEADSELTTDTTSVKRVYKFDIKDEIGPPIWRKMQQAFEEATEWEADLILLHMNTYGGVVTHADSMRTKILNSKIPVWVFIDNNAASAGALISIACDSIYMRKGANMGAATVVNQEGAQMPDKYQSYMRSTMRSTAEAKGRNPDIAEAMVDASLYVEGVSDSGKVITFTASEAIKFDFCEGMHESVDDVLKTNGYPTYELKTYEVTELETFIGWMVNPAVSGILIMIIIGGIYFEMQSPGIGFPIAASITAALLYFTPLYLEGLAENWEVILFMVGIVLLAVEVFVIPGFGVAGIAGIAFVMTSLILALVGNVGLDFEMIMPTEIINAFLTVLLATVGGFFGSIYLAKKFVNSTMMSSLVLAAVQNKADGFVGVNQAESALIGRTGSASTILRPAGKVLIDDDIYDATALTGYIDKGEAIVVVKYETAQLFVRKA
ncbi:MAG: membrane-bound serine protease (ClpP class) [Bacteroidia bacterium]|jgi:membrane-bound serine protease (ClpP class)